MNSGVRSRLLWKDGIPGNCVVERIAVEVWMGGQTSKDKSKLLGFFEKGGPSG
jgi:hypothetical protein